jgi:uncharacterized protein YciI
MRTLAILLSTTAFAATPLEERMLELHAFNRKNVLAAAESLQAYDLNYRPTAEVRSLRELLAHIADANYVICSGAKGAANPQPSPDATEKAAPSREELLKALRGSFDYCDSAVRGTSEAAQKGLGILAYHVGQHYGNLVTYLRLKGMRPPTAGEDRAKRAGLAPGEGMATYFMGFLKRGPNSSGPGDPEIQKQHLAHLVAMSKAGKLLVAGPFADGGDIRGILIMKVASKDEAETLASADPAVKAGRLAVEMHPWLVQKGVLPE